MTGKEFLKELQSLDARIRIQSLQLDELEGRVRGLRSVRNDGTKIQQPAKADQILEGLMKLEALQGRIMAEIVTLEEDRDKLLKVISSMENKVHAELITRRAVYGMEWDDIAEAMHYSRSLVCHQYGKALQELEQITI